MLALLGNAFFVNDVSYLLVKNELHTAASAGLDKHRPFTLNENLYWLVCDSLLKKVASRKLQFFLIAKDIFPYLGIHPEN